MPIPEIPEPTVARTNNPTNGIRGRVFQMTATMSLCFLASMHRPEPSSPKAVQNTTDNATETLDGATEEQKAELDVAADACIAEAQSNPMIIGRVSYFLLWNPNPGMEEIKELTDSMPESMQPRFQTIARLVALNPQEALRLKTMVGKKLGIEMSDCGNNHAYCERECRATAIGYLRLCDSPHVKELDRKIPKQEVARIAK